MAVKDATGRTRYVAFRVIEGAPISRGALSALLPTPAKLTRFDGTHGIVRTRHAERDRLVSFLRGLDRVAGEEVRLETLATSGTIRKAAQALPPGSPAAARTRPPPKPAKAKEKAPGGRRAPPPRSPNEGR